jgi:hypothetical protein
MYIGTDMCPYQERRMILGPDVTCYTSRETAGFCQAISGNAAT